MRSDSPQVFLSEIDEKRFGIRTARALGINLDTLPSVIDFCRANNVVLLIARCLVSEIRAAQAMEREGFFLMDTLVYYVRDLEKIPIAEVETGKIAVRSIRPGEEDAVRVIAVGSFRDYLGHYHSDERLDRAKCDEAYASWAVRSCVSKDVAQEVVVAEQERNIVGFATLRLNKAEETEGVLFGVAPGFQGQGIYRSLMISGMKWSQSKGARHMIVSTQIVNISVQKVWTRLGFEPSHAYHTFHKWFSRP